MIEKDYEYTSLSENYAPSSEPFRRNEVFLGLTNLNYILDNMKLGTSIDGGKKIIRVCPEITSGRNYLAHKQRN
jgi:hypothetical protein